MIQPFNNSTLICPSVLPSPEQDPIPAIAVISLIALSSFVSLSAVMNNGIKLVKSNAMQNFIKLASLIIVADHFIDLNQAAPLVGVIGLGVLVSCKTWLNSRKTSVQSADKLINMGIYGSTAVALGKLILDNFHQLKLPYRAELMSSDISIISNSSNSIALYTDYSTESLLMTATVTLGIVASILLKCRANTKEV